MSNYPHPNLYWNQDQFHSFDNFHYFKEEEGTEPPKVPIYAQLEPSHYGMPIYSPVPDYYYAYQHFPAQMCQELPPEVHYYKEDKEERNYSPEPVEAENISLNNLEEMEATTSRTKKEKKRKSRTTTREELEGYEYVDTKDVCNRVIHELEELGVSQSLFAEKVIQRTQGTLSDILRCPRPWSELKSGRMTYIKMLHWLELSEQEKLDVIHARSGPRPHQHKKRKSTEDIEQPKRQRVSFTLLQKKTLDTVFLEVKNPRQEVKDALAKKLGLSVPTVSNYFMNERRKAKRLQSQEASQEE